MLSDPEEFSDCFEIIYGVRKGCVLSSHFFGQLYKKKKKKKKRLTPNPGALNKLLFADGKYLAHKKEEQLQEHATTLNTVRE